MHSGTGCGRRACIVALLTCGAATAVAAQATIPGLSSPTVASLCQADGWRTMPPGQMIKVSLATQSWCDGVQPPLPPPPLLMRSMTRRASGAGALAIETLGGTLGSAAGFGLGVLISRVDECHSDDLQCTLEKVGIALGLSGAGAGAGSFLAGRIGATEPSGWGALIGGFVAIPAGIGVVHLISEELELSRGDFVLAASYTLTQGLLSAIGSRIGAALRE